jgi:hypothetical protein
MASLKEWKWSDFWAYFEQIENSADKAYILTQIDAKWIKQLSADSQYLVFEYAPSDFIKNIKHLLRFDTIQYLNQDKKRKRKIK